jgi:hypothetical protein
MSTRLAPHVLPTTTLREAALPVVGRVVLKVLVIALIAMVVVATRYLLFEYAHGGESVVLSLLQFVLP